MCVCEWIFFGNVHSFPSRQCHLSFRTYSHIDICICLVIFFFISRIYMLFSFVQCVVRLFLLLFFPSLFYIFPNLNDPIVHPYPSKREKKRKWTNINGEVGWTKRNERQKDGPKPNKKRLIGIFLLAHKYENGAKNRLEYTKKCNKNDIAYDDGGKQMIFKCSGIDHIVLI